MNFPSPTPVGQAPGVSGSGVGGSGSGRMVALVGGILAIVVAVGIIGAVVAFNLLGSGNSGEQEPAQILDSGSESAQRQSSGSGSANSGSSSTESSGSQVADTSDSSIGVGGTIDVQGIGATLNEVRTLPESEMDQTSSSDNQFVAADMTFENTTNEPVGVSSLLEIVLKDADGYSASQTIHTAQRPLAEGNIAPGEKTSGEIVYEVPSDAESLQLDFTPAFGTETFTWEVGDAATLSGPAGSANGVDPSSITASGTSPSAPDASGNTISYGADNAVDGDISTAWNVDGNGIGQSITLEYGEPVTISEIGIIPGYDKIDPSDGTYRFYQLYVVRQAEISFSDGSSVTIDFDRDPFMQYVDVLDVETTSIEINITDTYPPGTSPYGEMYPYTLDKAAISEIQVSGP